MGHTSARKRINGMLIIAIIKDKVMVQLQKILICLREAINKTDKVRTIIKFCSLISDISEESTTETIRRIKHDEHQKRFSDYII